MEPACQFTSCTSCRAMDFDPAFHTFDLTLTDRELEDFLSYMDHQTTGAYTDSIPQLPDVAMDFPGLQLQPHTDSPSNSEGSESIGVDPPVIGLPQFGGSTSSFSTGPGAPCCGDTSNNNGEALSLLDDLPTMLDNSVKLPKLEDMEIKVEPGTEPRLPSPTLPLAVGVAPAAVPAAAVAAAPAVMPAAAVPAVSMPAAAATPSVAVSLPYTAAVQPAAAMGLQSISPNAMALPAAAIGQWAGANSSTVQQGLAQVLFIQAPARAAAAQQQHHALQTRQGSMNRTSSAAALGSAAAAQQQQQQQASQQGGRGTPAPTGSGGSGKAGHHHRSVSMHEAGSGKLQVSHSTVEKQRRDRLNSLIDELSDIVPPADPKYGNDATSVRRPKHVVLSDTINLLKAMQTKLQIEEAEICTLKQQATAVAVMAAAQHNQQQGLAAVAAAAAAANGGVSPLSRAGSGDGGGVPVLPLAPDGSVASTGVLVEQGVDCLFVKVNCKDRKGLLSDVVSALKAFPVVIATAAITTTKEGTVHDVFEVRIEDPSVTPEDIQCAVHLALFTGDRNRSKRLRADDAM